MRPARRSVVSALKLAAFAAMCLVLTGWLVVKVGNIQLFAHRSGYSALLSDATGLAAGDDVEIAGVPVGRVGSVGVDHGVALVTFSLDSDVRLRQGTGVGMRWLNVLGDKVLYLYPPKSGAWLAPGARLPLSADVADASVGALLDTLSPFLQSIDPKEANEFVVAVSDALEGNTGTVRSLVDNGAQVASTLGADNQQIGAVIDEYQQVAGALAAHKDDVAAVVQNLATLGKGLAAHDSELVTMVANLGDVTKEFGDLLATNHATLDGTITNVDAVATLLQEHESSLAQSLRTLPTGLAPYQEISSYGQWFEIQVVYSCIAAEQVCTYYNATDQPAGSTTPLPYGSPLGGLTPSAGSPSGVGSATGGAQGAAGGLAGLFDPLGGMSAP
jgi:phospholipid/cholesterol/gamma-HCH transport system substrate-binding protein